MLRRLVVPIVAAIAMVLVLTSNGDVVENDEIQYTYSRDPAEVVVFVSSTNKMRARTRSMTVYGDGRVELSYGRRHQLVEEHVTHLDSDALEELVAIAANHRLPEWSETSLYARMSKTLGAGNFSISDGTGHRFIIALESYKRGAITREGSMIFEFDNVAIAAGKFPEIPEFTGARLLIEKMEMVWKQVESDL